jgi:hypothetical protein
MDGWGFIRRRGILRSNPSYRALGQRVRSNRGGAAARVERSAAFHGRPARARWSSARLVLLLMVWGREGSKTERMARGLLPSVQCDRGWPQGGRRRRLGLSELRRRRTASPEVLRLWLSLLRLWSGSGNLLRCLAWWGRLRLGTMPAGWIGNESGNGEKCSGGRRMDLFIGEKALAGAQQQPDPTLQLNSGFGERIGK